MSGIVSDYNFIHNLKKNYRTERVWNVMPLDVISIQTNGIKIFLDKNEISTYVCSAIFCVNLECFPRHKKYYLILQVYKNCQISPPKTQINFETFNYKIKQTWQDGIDCMFNLHIKFDVYLSINSKSVSIN